VDNVPIKGLKELERNLGRLSTRLQTKIIPDALRLGAEVIQQQAQSNAPVKSGFLRSEIKVKSGLTKAGKVSFIVTVGKQNFTEESFYGAIQEFGTLNTGRKTLSANGRKRKNKTGVVIKGKHFMQRAFNQRHQQAESIIMHEILKGIEKELKV
jgi:HK97 gp10 family phage protein